MRPSVETVRALIEIAGLAALTAAAALVDVRGGRAARGGARGRFALVLIATFSTLVR
jgi:hypothetical protein